MMKLLYMCYYCNVFIFSVFGGFETTIRVSLMLNISDLKLNGFLNFVSEEATPTFRQLVVIRCMFSCVCFVRAVISIFAGRFFYQ